MSKGESTLAHLTTENEESFLPSLTNKRMQPTATLIACGMIIRLHLRRISRRPKVQRSHVRHSNEQRPPKEVRDKREASTPRDKRDNFAALTRWVVADC